MTTPRAGGKKEKKNEPGKNEAARSESLGKTQNLVRDDRTAFVDLRHAKDNAPSKNVNTFFRFFSFFFSPQKKSFRIHHGLPGRIWKMHTFSCIPSRTCYNVPAIHASSGEVVEWSIAPVLKTGEPKGSVGSNPTLSANTPAQFIWVGVLAFSGRDKKSAPRAMGLNASFACSEI
jgi:hypothetical protein